MHPMALGGRVMSGERRLGVVMYKYARQLCEWYVSNSLNILPRV
jgi:hypothetical protein